jgi:spermidine/putrescine transport system permease protein
MKLKPSVQAYLLLSPALVTVVLALVVCLGVMLVLSVWTQSYLDISATWTLDNYRQLIEKPLFVKLLLRSAAISAIVTLVSVALAYPMAYFIAFDVHDRKLTWLIFLTLPFWISYLLRILSWKLILGFNGVINTALIEGGMVTEPLSFLLYNPTAIVIALIHAWAPFALLPIYVSLEKVDRSLIAASSDLGDSPFWTFLRVTLPLSMPGVTAAALLIFIPTFGDYITPALVGGPSGAMIGTFITMQFGASNNWPLGSAVSIASMLIATLIACLALGGARKALQMAN